MPTTVDLSRSFCNCPRKKNTVVQKGKGLFGFGEGCPISIHNDHTFLTHLATCFFLMFSVECQPKTTKAAGETTITFAEEGKVGFCDISLFSSFFKQHQKTNMSSPSLTFLMFKNFKKHSEPHVLHSGRFFCWVVVVGWLVGLVWFGLVWFGWVGLGCFALLCFGLVWFGLGWLVGWLVGWLLLLSLSLLLPLLSPVFEREISPRKQIGILGACLYGSNHQNASVNTYLLGRFELDLPFPDAQCMVYLPTFTPKTTQM